MWRERKVELNRGVKQEVDTLSSTCELSTADIKFTELVLIYKVERRYGSHITSSSWPDSQSKLLDSIKEDGGSKA